MSERNEDSEEGEEIDPELMEENDEEEFEDAHLIDFLSYGDTSDVELHTILNSSADDAEDETSQSHIWLPAHIRCAAHTLSLVATVDIDAILRGPFCSSVRGLYNQSFKKMQELWNKINRSTKSADLAFDLLGNLAYYLLFQYFLLVSFCYSQI